MPNFAELRGTEPAAVFEHARARAEESLRIYEEVHAIVGHAKSDDGLIRAGYSNADGPVELALEPDALRLNPDELASRILRVLRAAIVDAREQSRRAAVQLTSQDSRSEYLRTST